MQALAQPRTDPVRGPDTVAAFDGQNDGSVEKPPQRLLDRRTSHARDDLLGDLIDGETSSSVPGVLGAAADLVDEALEHPDLCGISSGPDDGVTVHADTALASRSRIIARIPVSHARTVVMDSAGGRWNARRMISAM